MNVLILGGFLGSGKTTVLLQVIEYAKRVYGGPSPVAIIENEIGEVSVDGGVVGNRGYAVRNMLAGCACCELLGELPDAVRSLEQDLAPDLLVIETTGVAVPQSMRDVITRMLDGRVRVCVVVDASRWRRIRIPLQVVLAQQLDGADAVLVNKVDLVDEEEARFVEESLRDLGVSCAVRRVVGDEGLSDDDLAFATGVSLSDASCISAAEGAHEADIDKRIRSACEASNHQNESGHRHRDRHDHHDEAVHELIDGRALSVDLTVRAHGETAVATAVVRGSESDPIVFADLVSALEALAGDVETGGGVVGHIKASVKRNGVFAHASVTDAAHVASFEGDSSLPIDATAQVDMVAIAASITVEELLAYAHRRLSALANGGR